MAQNLHIDQPDEQQQYYDDFPTSPPNAENNPTISSPPNYTELLKIKTSGLEITVNLPNLNENYLNYLEMQNKRNQQPPQRTGRIQNRMHPYHKPTENCRHYHSCPYSCCAAHIPNVNSGGGSSINDMNTQNTDNPQFQPQFQQQFQQQQQ